MSVLEYLYVRIKNTFSDDGEVKLFLFAGLTKVTSNLQLGINKKHTKAVVAEIIEVPIEDALPAYLDMKNHDLRVSIKEEEFNRLKRLSESDIEAFFTYNPEN